MIKNILGRVDFIESLRGKSATLMLALSNTKTAQIEGITQAGILGSIHLTPTLDSEFVSIGEVRSLKNIAKTSKGVPTPALISRAIHLLKPFKEVEFLDLGLELSPQIEHFKIHKFNISPSDSIEMGANIDAFKIFEKGVAFGQSFKPKSDFVILGECVPSGTTTAQSCALALGYEVENRFSSSFATTPEDIKKSTITKALSNIKEGDDIFKKLGKVGDNMLIFNAGFIIGANDKDYKILLAGGTQMACVLLIINSILNIMNGEIDSSKIALATTKWVYEDKNSDIRALLELLSFKIDAYFADFDFSRSRHPALKLYDQGEAKEGVGAGGCLVYGFLNGLRDDEIVKKIEEFLE